jgi:hypothetical protein
MFIPSTLNFVKAENPDPYWMQLRRIYEQVAKAFNGRVSLGILQQQIGGTTLPADNLDAVSVLQTVNVAANTDFALTHNLSRIPTGYIVTGASANYGCIYTGVTAWTTALIYLRFSVAYNAAIKLLVW